MIKINTIMTLKCTFFSIILLCQTSLFANDFRGTSVNVTDKKVEKPVKEVLVRFIQIKPVKLTDNSGLTYIGGKVSAADLAPYLSEMKEILGDDFILYRQNQSARDHQTFHMTLINPYEYQSLTKEVTLGASISVSLRGLARVNVENKTTFFVVAQSSQAKLYRQKLALNNKDFHVTLGFNPTDIFGVNKGVEALIK